MNRSILSALNSYSIKSEVALDFRQLLQYPLCLVPLSICNGDSTRRRTNKSRLTEVMLICVVSLALPFGDISFDLPFGVIVRVRRVLIALLFMW